MGKFEQHKHYSKITPHSRKHFSTDYIFVIYCTVIFMSMILMDTVDLIYEIVILINILCN
jgi:hypothetical protein